MARMPNYDDSVGWLRVEGLVTPDVAATIAAVCEGLADDLTEVRAGDKPHGATRRLTGLDERLPGTRAIAEALGAVVDQILPTGWTVTEIAYRSPGPGTGHQQLHADDIPRLDPRAPAAGATAVVALVAFTPDNGATRVVPGSHRRVDQQRVSQKVDHLEGEEVLTGVAGTAFVFSSHLLHAGSLNASNRPRPALQISYRATQDDKLPTPRSRGRTAEESVGPPEPTNSAT
ncbi:MAG: phytanoyl-CoA dioxygenase family protein [Ilumatobacteraceae bacterium]